MVAWSAFGLCGGADGWNKKLRMSKQEMRDEQKETMAILR